MIYESGLISLFIQFITGLIDIYGIKLPVGDNFTILKEILTVELGVQVIEFIFYIWLVFSIHSIKNITIYRYMDWFITTPIMLITLMAYLSIKTSETTNLWKFVNDNKENIIYVVLLNMAMLGFGVLGEFIPRHNLIFVLLGFIPFVLYFKKIYDEYYLTAKEDIHPVFTRERIFWYFVVIWALYGIIALFPYTLKNISFNIIDLFSKNGFGIMLVYILFHHRIKYND
jgi:bacteriorhodopsin